MHCWTGNDEAAEQEHGFGSPEWAEAYQEPATCMLPHGHEGPHEFTPDDRIGVTFADDNQTQDAGWRSQGQRTE